MAVEARSEYLQIKPTTNFITNVQQIEERTTPDQIQAAQTKLSEKEVLPQTLRHLTSEVEGLKKIQGTTVPKKKKRSLLKVWKGGTHSKEL